MYPQVSEPNQCLPSQSKNKPYMIHIYYIIIFPANMEDPGKTGNTPGFPVDPY